MTAQGRQLAESTRLAEPAKAIAVATPGHHTIAEFASRFELPDTFHQPEVDVEPLPVLTMPTTFSAAEVVGGGAFTDTATGRKLIFVHPKLTLKLVILDGEAVASTPRSVLTASGMNAVHHCLEALYSKGAQPTTDAFALRAFAGLVVTLPALAPKAPMPAEEPSHDDRNVKRRASAPPRSRSRSDRNVSE